ncbi:MAG: hypothetical protein O3B95_07815 [Chloroflexi bacterium]|nr:hypothetical protein [Chloroflexota bacterium]
MNFSPLPVLKNVLGPWWVRLLVVSVFSLALVTFDIDPFGGTNVVQAQEFKNEIRGVVVNGTEGGSIPAGLEVLLLTVNDQAGQIIEQKSIAVDTDGTFAFGNLISSPGVTFRVVANAGDYTPSVDLAEVDDWTNVRLTIYDPTTSLDDLTINSYVMMVPTIDARSRQAGILSVVNVSNRGSNVWIPDLADPTLTGLDLLRFNLPDGFSDLTVESELPAGNVLEIQTGFALTNPVPPGDFAILMSYIIPYQGDGFEFTLKLPYGADVVRLQLPDGGGTITGNGLGSAESVVVADSVFNSFEGAGYAADENVELSFTGMPQPTLLQTLGDFFNGRTYVIVIIWVVGIALLAVLGYALYSSKRGNMATSEDDDEPATRADIVAEIAALDEDYEALRIGEDDYNERRGELTRLALEFDRDVASEMSESENHGKSDLGDSEDTSKPQELAEPEK